MKKVDFLFVYEVKNRELENITLMAAELLRRGYSVRFINSWQGIDTPFPDYEAKVVVLSACYNDDVYHYFTKHASKFEKVVNLQWEQVLRNGYVETEGSTSWDFSGQALSTMHICWGENTKRRLMAKYGVPERFLKVCGYIPLDFYRPEFRSFIMDKSRLFSQFGLDENKTTCLFISSFAIAHMPKNNQGQTSDNFNEIFIKNTIDTQEGLIDWLVKACREYPDIQFIYRGHPSEPENENIRYLSEEVDNFFYISEYPIKHWIANCDKIYNWTSTSAAEVYAAKKQSFIVEPVPVEHKVTYPFFENSDTVNTYEKFKESLEMDISLPCQPLDEKQFADCYLVTEKPVYENICDAFEEIYKDETYTSPVPFGENTAKSRKAERAYMKFWYSDLNIRFIKLAKKTKLNIPFLNVRRNARIPDRAALEKQARYNRGRVQANKASREEIDSLMKKYASILGERN